MTAVLSDAEGAAAIRNWVAKEIGGDVVKMYEVSGGKSRMIYALDVVKGDGVLPLLVRQETGLGAHSGTVFTMRREAEALIALESAAVKTPRIYGVSERGDAILMQRLPGAATLPKEPEIRLAAIASFAQELAALHRVDASKLNMPVPKPADAREGALNDLADWKGSYERLCKKHANIDDGFDWLERNAPRTGLRAGVVHGDPGPGNFMHENGKVTGLIDWEMTHLGDPHEDLAWLWFRVNIIHQDIEADSYFANYLRASGLAFDRERCIYYITQTMMRCVIASSVRTHHDPSYEPRVTELRGMLDKMLADARQGELTRMPPLPACVR